MSIQFVKPLNMETVKQTISERIASAKENYKIWKIIQSVCTTQEGKGITKRIEKLLQKELPDYIVQYENRYGMFHVHVWGNESSYDNRRSYLLGYETNPVFDIDKINEYNMWAELEQSRVNKLESMTNDELKSSVISWNNALDTLKDIREWAHFYELDSSLYGFDLTIR